MFLVQILPLPLPPTFFYFINIVQYLFVPCTIPSTLGSHPPYPTSPPTYPQHCVHIHSNPPTLPTRPHLTPPPPTTPPQKKKIFFFLNFHKNFNSSFTSTLTPQPEPPPPTPDPPPKKKINYFFLIFTKTSIHCSHPP